MKRLAQKIKEKIDFLIFKKIVLKILQFVVLLSKHKATNKKNFYLFTIKTLIHQNYLSEALMCIYFKIKKEYKAEKFLYIKPKPGHINLRIT